MIFGIGTDIVRVARMQRNLDRYGERFAARILGPDELDAFHHNSRPANFLARRFAAKEATAKAMGTGFAGGLALRHITVTHEPGGRPVLACMGRAADFLQQHAITETHLSLSDEAEYAIAYVILIQGK